jgi:hypothetical protein
MSYRNQNLAITILLTIVLLTGLALTACVSTQPRPMRLLQPSTTLRDIQSRSFEMPSEQAALSASINVLQDMNYTIDATNTELGILTASKNGREKIEFNSTSVVIGDVLCIMFILQRCNPQLRKDKMALASPGNTVYTRPEQTMLTLVVTPDPVQAGAYIVRISMQSVLIASSYNTTPILKTKLVMDKTRYQAFFEKLSKSAFLETNL